MLKKKVALPQSRKYLSKQFRSGSIVAIWALVIVVEIAIAVVVEAAASGHFFSSYWADTDLSVCEQSAISVTDFVFTSPHPQCNY